MKYRNLPKPPAQNSNRWLFLKNLDRVYVAIDIRKQQDISLAYYVNTTQVVLT
jgi:hypothetical protein